ncbi:MAG: SpoIIE family protein phosphatase [bacterium]|nr:SpoIIE family protein phosphatase [bacterium]
MTQAVFPPQQFDLSEESLVESVRIGRQYIADAGILSLIEGVQIHAAQQMLQTILTALVNQYGVMAVTLSAALDTRELRFNLLMARSAAGEAWAALTPAHDVWVEVDKNPSMVRITVRRHPQKISPREAERLTETMANVILPLGVALASETDFDRLLERILMEAKALCRADAGTLYLRQDDMLHFTIIMTDSLGIHLGGSSPKPVTFPSLPLYDQTGTPNRHNAATYAALTGQSINVPDMYAADGFDFSAAKRFDEQNNYRSISNLTVPLLGSSGEVVGVIQLLNARDDDGFITPFGQYDELMVEILTAQAAVVLNTRLLWQKQEQLMRIQNDMRVAQAIQRNFIPDTLPQIPGWDVGGLFQPARDVSGDFYDLFTLSDGRIIIMIGDVCDKGVGAALFMSLTRSLMRAFTTQAPSQSPFLDLDIDPQEVRAYGIRTAVTSTNTYITRHHEDLNMFTTLFIGVIDPLSGLLTYINGGHAPPLVVRQDGTVKKRLKLTGQPVGMFENAAFNTAEWPLEPGDLLLCYTDGITDARNEADTQFGDHALAALLPTPHPNVCGLLETIQSAVNTFIGGATQFDDITMVAIQRAPVLVD